MKKKNQYGEDVDELVRQYADADRSDTFVSYNDAIVLAKEVRKLRRQLAKRTPNPGGSTMALNDGDIAAIINAERAEHE